MGNGVRNIGRGGFRMGNTVRQMSGGVSDIGGDAGQGEDAG